jgi:sterol desaturase/sphingolipid hydroxylase (fatty acid hydroxylase superfamily)
MHLNFLAWVVPLILGFIAIEYYVARRQGKAYFKFANSISNLNIGIAERLSDVFVTSTFYFVYDYLYQHYAFFKIPETWYNWVFLFLVTDLIWYWYHRFGHEINLLWGLHIVHHQSPEFNYTASVRITVFQAAARTCFWAILPIIGFSAPMITSILIVHGLYPFFVHTRVIGKLGWLEYVFVTPSHHRVHHASNEQYLDKNYGDVLIIWDKLFGTFTEEKEEPVYGLTTPLNSYSFLWQHFHFLLEIGFSMYRAKSIREKFRILFGKPDLIDPKIRPLLERKFRIQNRANDLPNRLNRYVLIQIICTMCILFVFILLEHYFDWIAKTLVSGLILTTVINCGAILEQRRWIFQVELLRSVVLGIAVLVYFPLSLSVGIISLGAGTAILYYEELKQHYLALVYRRA